MIPVFSPLTGLAGMVRSLFSAGEQGAWYDPSDLSTMYQDAAGTIPVTAVGKPVGKILDKSGRGNHATQSTTTSRPVLSARVNLLTKTEQFGDAAWSKYQVPLTDNFITGPFGRPATLFVADTNGGEHSFWQNVNFTSGLRYQFSIYLKNHTTTYGLYSFNDNFAFGYNAYVAINLNAQTITGGSGSVNRKLTSLGDGWFKAEFEAVATSTASGAVKLNLLNSAGAILFNGNGVSGVYLGAVDLRVANESASLPPYQRVNTSTDYDTVGFPYYLSFDGVDDYLSTGSIDFTATDKMTVLAGVQKNSDAAAGIVVELSADRSANAGAFSLYAPAGGTNQYLFGSRGTVDGAFAVVSPRTYPTTQTAVLTGIGNISGDQSLLRVNGSTAATEWTIDQGTGNFGNYPLYIGRRNGASLPFKGRLYGLIVRGAATDDLHLTHAEKYLANKSGVTL